MAFPRQSNFSAGPISGRRGSNESFTGSTTSASSSGSIMGSGFGKPSPGGFGQDQVEENKFEETLTQRKARLFKWNNF
jgi:hypothetical protein